MCQGTKTRSRYVRFSVRYGPHTAVKFMSSYIESHSAEVTPNTSCAFPVRHFPILPPHSSACHPPSHPLLHASVPFRTKAFIYRAVPRRSPLFDSRRLAITTLSFFFPPPRLSGRASCLTPRDTAHEKVARPPRCNYPSLLLSASRMSF